MRPRKTPSSSSVSLTRRNLIITAVAVVAFTTIVILALSGAFTESTRSAAPRPVHSAPAALPSDVPQAGKVPTKVPNDPALRKNVTVSDCSQAGKGWKAAGKATNPSDKPLDYTLTVFFTSDKATVLNTADTSVKVEPGKTAEWTIQKDFPATAKTLCVLRGVGTK